MNTGGHPCLSVFIIILLPTNKGSCHPDSESLLMETVGLSVIKTPWYFSREQILGLRWHTELAHTEMLAN